MKISLRIFFGFFSVTLLLGIVATIGYISVSNVGDGITRYRQLALQTNASGRVQANMLTARLFVKNYIIMASDVNINGVRIRTDVTMKMIDELRDLIQTDDKRAVVQEVRGDLELYISTFDDVTSLQAKRHNLVRENLDLLGPKMERGLTKIMESARKDNDSEASFLAGMVLRQLLLARLYVRKYLVENDDASHTRVNLEFSNMLASRELMLRSLDDPERRKLANSVVTMGKEYEQFFREVYSIIEKRNDLIENTLDKIGPEIADDIENLKLSIKSEQDILGPQMMETVRSDEFQTLLISMIALVITFILSISIGRSISRPINSMTQTMAALAEGDLEVNVPDLDRSDEIGQMAKAVQIFKDNAIQVKTNSTEIFGVLQSTQTLEEFCREAISRITPLMDSGHGTMHYFDEKSEELLLKGSYGFSDRKSLSNRFELGQGLVGQCALERQMITLSNIPSDYVTISSGLGESSPRAIIAAPIIHMDKLLAVIEVASFTEFDDAHKRMLNDLLPILGLNMENMIRSQRTQELLDQMTLQADVLKRNEEELIASEEEMQTSNEELTEKTRLLESQAESLRASEEETRVTNEELVEKSNTLENQALQLQDANEQNELRTVELEEASRYKSEFLANMSHELRTPLNSMLILSKSLSENTTGEMNSENVESAEIIHESGSNLLRLINDILDLSKVESGYMEVSPSQIDPSNLIIIAERKFAHVAADKNIQYKFNMHGEMPNHFVTDETKVDQILTNLIGNAVKFTEKGSVDVTMEMLPVETPSDTAVLSISVQDTGAGIPEDQIGRIFEAFRQADGTSSRRFGGTGLGLSIARNMAKLLGGDISVESVEDEGSTFTLTLPNMPSNEKTDIASIPTKAEKKYEAPNKSTNKIDIANLSEVLSTLDPYIEDDRDKVSDDIKPVLIIEDDPVFAKILCNQVRKRKLLCVAVNSGAEGIKLANIIKPIGIILDVGLPDIDGWNVIDILKRKSSTSHIPIHFISAQDDNKHSEEHGAESYMQKPVKKSEINRVLDDISQFIDAPIGRVLMVEDDDNSAVAIKKIFSNENFDIDRVPTGKEALKSIQSGKYTCVILDLCLPDIDGFKVLEKMQSLKMEHALPSVVIYSARDLTEGEISKIREHTDSIVVKGERSSERLLDEVTLFLHRIQDHPKAKHPQGQNQTEELLFNKTILVVDDDMRNTFALSKVLRENGMKVEIAQDGHKALAKLDATPSIEIVLMDIMMPGMDGYETMREIRKDNKFKELPIIAVTAKAMKGDRELCLKAGATDYLSKPIDIDALIVLMRKVMIGNN